MSGMSIHEILQYLPHRYPFLLVDRVLEMVPGKSLVAIKNITANEPFFTGHFPERMVMPGVLILEALAQATGILAFKSHNEHPDGKSLYFFAGIDNARFKKVVEPGDQLRLEVTVTKVKQDFWKFTGVATVDGVIVCSADMMSAKRNIERD